jgi:AcrR family transcriptional regulator
VRSSPGTAAVQESTAGPPADPAPKLGRPLDPELSDRLRAAALDLLVELGLTRLSTDHVARRCAAGKSAVYRRWPSLVALVADAVCRMPGVVPSLRLTGDLRADLLAFLAPLGERRTQHERALGSLFGAANAEPMLADALDEVLFRPLDATFTGLVVADRMDAPVAPELLDLARRLVRGAWTTRLAYFGHDEGPPLSPETFVDVLLLPLLNTERPVGGPRS